MEYINLVNKYPDTVHIVAVLVLLYMIGGLLVQFGYKVWANIVFVILIIGATFAIFHISGAQFT